MFYALKKCDCSDCSNSDDSCSFDCDSGYECEGCQEMREEQAELNFEFDCLEGRR